MGSDICSRASVSYHWQEKMGDKANGSNGSINEITRKADKSNLIKEGPRDTKRTKKKVNQLQRNIKRSSECKNFNFFSIKYSSPETHLYFHFTSSNSLKIQKIASQANSINRLLTERLLIKQEYMK